MKTKTKVNAVPVNQTDYITEALKLIESNEMREHLFEWLVSGYVRQPVDICAEIVYKAPVPTEHKLSVFKLLMKYERNMSTGAMYLNELRRELSGRRNDDDFEIPGRLNLPTPFAPGDIVVADCRPFWDKKIVLILENNDAFDFVDGDGVTCLFLNDSNDIDVGYFKSNEFLTYPDLTHVSVLYRAKRYMGELSEPESILKVIGKAVKDNPELGNIIFRRLRMFWIPVFDRPRDIGSFDYKRFGVSREFFSKEFGIKF